MQNGKTKDREKNGAYYMGVFVTIIGIIIFLTFMFGAIFG